MGEDGCPFMGALFPDQVGEGVRPWGRGRADLAQGLQHLRDDDGGRACRQGIHWGEGGGYGRMPHQQPRQKGLVAGLGGQWGGPR